VNIALSQNPEDASTSGGIPRRVQIAFEQSWEALRGARDINEAYEQGLVDPEQVFNAWQLSAAIQRLLVIHVATELGQRLEVSTVEALVNYWGALDQYRRNQTIETYSTALNCDYATLWFAEEL
jgi:hypothetical protein